MQVYSEQKKKSGEIRFFFLNVQPEVKKSTKKFNGGVRAAS